MSNNHWLLSLFYKNGKTFPAFLELNLMPVETIQTLEIRWLIERSPEGHGSTEEDYILVGRDELEKKEGRQELRKEVILKLGLIGINTLKKER